MELQSVMTQNGDRSEKSAVCCVAYDTESRDDTATKLPMSAT
jgi:hypothetical protein